jgi:LacI family transcriptional regulator, sucrose operon repressor
MAGVSKTTISLVVNGKSRAGRISPETENRVLEIVRKTGYATNKVARGFRLKHSQTLGLVVPDLRNPFFAELNHEFEGIARSHGYQLLVSCANDNKAVEQDAVNSLLSYSIEGLFVASVLNENQLLNRTYNRQVPVVFIDREIAMKNVSSVASDNAAGAADAVRVLLARGAVEIAYLGGLPDLSTSRNRMLGYRRALTEAGMAVNRTLVLQEDFSPAHGYRMLEILHQRLGRFPEALFTASYTLLEGVLLFLRERTGHIPKSPWIATFDDHPLLDYLPNRIISVKQDCTELARSAFRLFEGAIQKRPDRARHIRVRPILKVRE